MALLTLWGDVGCRPEETARLVSHRLGWELLTSHRLDRIISDEFGPEALNQPRARHALEISVLADLGSTVHLVAAIPDAPRLRGTLAPLFCVHLTAPPAHRAGFLMLEHRIDRAAAQELLRQQEDGRKRPRPDAFDLICNIQQLAPEQAADVIAAAAQSAHLADRGLLTNAAEAQFHARLQLAQFGLSPAGKVRLAPTQFATPSEKIFANLLDFYRIPWEYEPRSFPLRWDKQGNVVEAFTPDFFLPEFNLYVELTTMKQANVTRKNRKVRQLRALYPDVNIQVFYQKDVQDLVFKFGLAAPVAAL